MPNPKSTITDSSDTESVDENNQQQSHGKSDRKKFTINFPGIFMRTKGAKQPKDVEAATADDGNDDAARSEATVIIEDDPPKDVSGC